MDSLYSLIPKLILHHIIRIYQCLVSPFLGSNCRFQPTCSKYGIEVIHLFPILKGSWLVLKRVLKCHPLNQGGEDPIPIKSSKK